MSVNNSETNQPDTFTRWNLAAIEERTKAYQYVGLHPIAKKQTYYLVLSPLAVIDELWTKISEVSSSLMADLGNTPNHGFTMYAPKNPKYKTNSTKDTKQSYCRRFYEKSSRH